MPLNQDQTTNKLTNDVINDVQSAIALFQDNELLNQVPQNDIIQIMDAHKNNEEFRKAVWENLQLLHAESRNKSPNGEDLNADKKVVERWSQLVDMTNNAAYKDKNIDLIELDNYKQMNEEIFSRVEKLQTKKPDEETDLSQTNMAGPTANQSQQTHERTATVPRDPPKPMKTEDALKNMSQMVEKIFRGIDPTHKTYKAQLDSSLNAMILKGEKPMFSVQPEKISLMEPFGKPLGSDADIAKVEMLVKAGNAAFGQAIIYSTNPEHKEFLQQQADILGVKFADTPEKLAALKAERTVSLGTTVTSLDTTQPKPNNIFGSIDPVAQQAMSVAQAKTERKPSEKPLPDTPKTEYQIAIDTLNSKDKNVKENYLKSLLTDGKNNLFEIKVNNNGSAEISVAKTDKLTDAQGKELAKAFVNAAREILPLATFNVDSSQKNVMLNVDHFNSLKSSVGLDSTAKTTLSSHK